MLKIRKNYFGFFKMNSYENYEKYNMLECYIQSNKNRDAASLLYIERYPERPQPSLKIYQRLEDNLLNFGAFKKPRPTTYNKENKENDSINVIGCINVDPTTSCRNIQVDVGVSRTRSSKILKENKYKCYKARKTHHLHPGDAERRTEFCNWYLNQHNRDNNFFKNIIWTDESIVTSDGIFNRNNYHQWADTNPHEQVNRIRQGRFGFNVWMALLGNRILAYEVYNENLNSQRYLDVLERNVSNFIDNMPLLERNKLYFQHDGAPPHNAHIINEYLNVNFGDQWIANAGPVRWPARSPDLTPLDFFLWGFLKNKIYLKKSNTIEELREKFESAMREVTNIHIHNAIKGVQRRCQLCINQNGLQFEHLM